MYLDNVEVQENVKKRFEMGKYSAILNSCLVNNIGGFHFQVNQNHLMPIKTKALQII